MKKYICVIGDNDSFCTLNFHDKLTDLLEEVIERTMGFNSVVECYTEDDHITLDFFDKSNNEYFLHEIGNSFTEVKAWLTDQYLLRGWKEMIIVAKNR